MKDFKELLEIKNDYSELRDCIDEKDIINKLNDLNRSREVVYLDKNGIGTYDINEANVIKRDGNVVYVEGRYRVELGIRDITPIDVYVEVCATVDEDGEVETTGYKEIGWE